MTCGEAEDLIEPVASGDVTPPADFSSHVAECRRCAAALAAAERIERALAGEPAAAPVHFTQAVLASLRRRRWQHEERIDRAFNLTIAAAIVTVALGIVALLNASGVAQMLLVAIDTLSEIPQQSPPWPGGYSLPVASITGAFVATAVFIWWWAERRPGYGEP
jgi:hypothetical protein